MRTHTSRVTPARTVGWWAVILAVPPLLVVLTWRTGHPVPLGGVLTSTLLVAACALRRARGSAAAGRQRTAWAMLGVAAPLLSLSTVLPPSGEVAAASGRAGSLLGLGLVVAAVVLLLPASGAVRLHGLLRTAAVVLGWTVVALATATTPWSLPGAAEVVGDLLAVAAASAGILLLARVAAPGSLPLSAVVGVTAAVLLLAAREVVAVEGTGIPAALLVGAASLLAGATLTSSGRPAHGDGLAGPSPVTECLGALAPLLATVPAAGAVLSATIASDGLPPLTAVTAGALATVWLAGSLLAQCEAVATVRQLRSRADAGTLDRRMRETWFRSLVRSSTDVITVVDMDGCIRFQTPSVAHVLGHEPTALVGTPFGGLLRPHDAEHLRRTLIQAADAPRSVTTVGFAVRRGDGRWVDTETTITSLVSDPDINGIVLNTRDVSERRRLEQQLARQAYSDTLTGLANRLLFRDRVERALVQAAVPATVAALFCDLNGFKAVNDSLGHAAGDELLRLVAERLRRCVRPDDLVARLGGDEFAVLVVGTDAESAAVGVAERVRRALESPFRVHGRDVQVTTSTGIAVADTGAEDAGQLLRNADLAMYRAKADPEHRYVRFEPSMHESLVARVEVETELRRAVARDELVLHYQPVVDLVTDEVVGVEALIRWDHPERGLVQPEDFIGVAEEIGLLADIGPWALAHASENAARWQRYASPGQTFQVAVNVSARQVNEVTVGLVGDLLARSDVPAGALTLEVTESALMASDDAAALLRRLKDFGVRIAVDDFGTGYSSLSYLTRFPVDVLKIDRSFVADVDRRAGPVPAESVALASSIVHLGRSLGLTTVAEGIETPQQRDVMRAMGCTLGQGFLFSPAVPADELDALLSARRTAGVPA